MAEKFKAGDKVSAAWHPPDSQQMQAMTVTVIREEEPGLYRCQTNMGITMLLAEADLG